MILIGIGANLPGKDGGSPLDSGRRAVAQLTSLPALQLVAVSRWYLSEPIPPSCQPPYVNAVAQFEGKPGPIEPDPADVLRWLHQIEAQAGRERGEPNAARTLDLDIIAMGDRGAMVRQAPDPVLPHPRAHLRAFVLMPLLDLVPDWRHPLLGLLAHELLAELTSQAIRPISSALTERAAPPTV